MSRLIAELDTALEQRAGQRASPAGRLASTPSAAHAPFLHRSGGVLRWPMIASPTVLASIAPACGGHSSALPRLTTARRCCSAKSGSAWPSVWASSGWILRRSSMRAAAPARRWANCTRAIRARGWSVSTWLIRCCKPRGAAISRRGRIRDRSCGDCSARSPRRRGTLRWSAPMSAGCRSARAASIWSGAT